MPKGQSYVGYRHVHAATGLSSGLGARQLLQELLHDEKSPLRSTVPAAVEAALLPRETQIGPFEALAIVLALHTFGDSLEGADVLCFVDNTGAQAVATNGFASTLDCAVIASLIWPPVFW